MQNLTQEDIKNILFLISRANITGQEAIGVAILQQKLNLILNGEESKDKKNKETDNTSETK